MRKLATDVVGAGHIGWQFHIPEMAWHERFDLVTVVDPLPERQEEVHTQYDVRCYAEYEVLLEEEQLDLISSWFRSTRQTACSIYGQRAGVSVGRNGILAHTTGHTRFCLSIALPKTPLDSARAVWRCFPGQFVPG